MEFSVFVKSTSNTLEIQFFEKIEFVASHSINQGCSMLVVGAYGRTPLLFRDVQCYFSGRTCRNMDTCLIIV